MKAILTVDAISAPLTGIGRYTVELARGLACEPRIEQLSLFGGLRFVESVEDGLSAHRAIGAFRARVPLGALTLRAAFAARQRVFDRAARNLADAVLHCPNYVALRHEGPVVTTIHDLSWLHFPEFHPPGRVAFLASMLPRTLLAARRIVTDSEFVRREVIDRFGIAPARVVAVPLGVSEAFRPRAPDECAAVLHRHGLEAGRYVLSVGTREPRKNFGRLAQAYERVPEAARRGYPLVLVGASGWAWGEQERLVEGLEAKGQVRRLGFLEEQELAALVSSCLAFAFVSVYEGYGLPLLEAMASGVPTIRARGSALDEVGADAALTVDPYDVDSIAGALARALEDPAWRERSAARGLAIASERSWSRCVERTVDLYEDAAAVAAAPEGIRRAR